MYRECGALLDQKRRASAVLFLLVLFGVPSPLQAQSNLRLELIEAAKDVQLILKDRNEGSVAVGAFTGPSRLSASAGPGIQKVLIEEMQKLRIRVEKQTNLEVKGDYDDVIDKKTQLLAARLKFRVLDRSGKEVAGFEREVFGDATLPSLFGLTAQLPPGGNPQARRKQLEEAIDKPHATVKSSRIAASAESPFALEVLVKGPDGQFRPRPAKTTEGKAFVEIQRGEVYQIRLINEAPHEAAVTLTIDGLSVFAFSDVKDREGRPRYTNFVLDAKSSSVIKGWHITDQQADEFLVTEYARSARAEKNLLFTPDTVGTITVTFAAAWPKGATPPPGEPPEPPPFSRSGDATGRGQRIADNLTEVEREFGVVRSTVSVRYTK
jgi:hypothetical protein